MKYMKKHGGIHTMKKGGMYDAIMKFMGGGNMEYMQEGGKPDFLDLDKDGNKTESMKSAAASAKEMGKGGRMYRMGGMNEMGHGGVHKYPHGGVHDLDPEARLTYKEKKDEQGRTTKLFFIDGRPASPAQAIEFFYDEIGKRGQDDFNDFLTQQKMNVEKDRMQAKRKDISTIKEQLSKTPTDVRSGRTFSMAPEEVRQTARTQGGSFRSDDQGDIARKILEGLQFYRGNR